MGQAYFSEDIKFDDMVDLNAASVNAATTSSTYLPIQDYDRIGLVCVHDGVDTAGDTLTVALIGSDDSSGTTTTTIDSVQATSTSEGLVIVEAEAREFGTTYKYFTAKVTPSAGTVVCTVVAMRGHAKQKPVTQDVTVG